MTAMTGVDMMRLPMTEYRVVIPDESYTLLTFQKDDMPGVATINSALKTFEPKIVFGWHLSVLIVCEDDVENRMPSPNEQGILYGFEDFLETRIKTEGNALFLARVTHDARRQLIWRVHDPEIAAQVMKDVIATESYPLEFDYLMEHDPEWKLAQWYMDNVPEPTTSPIRDNEVP